MRFVMFLIALDAYEFKFTLNSKYYSRSNPAHSLAFWSNGIFITTGKTLVL